MKHFNEDMTIAEAMTKHKKVREIFAHFHLGGCGSCTISEVEDIKTVCEGYGVPIDMLLDTLESLFDESNMETKTAITELESGCGEKLDNVDETMKDLNN